MQDWREGEIRYLVHFDDGGSGMRYRRKPLVVGDGLTDGGRHYRVERVEPPPNPQAFGHAWVAKLEVRVTAPRARPSRAR